MERRNYYLVALGGATGVFYVRCRTAEDVKREITNNSDGYFRLTIWEMENEETALRRCDPSEF